MQCVRRECRKAIEIGDEYISTSYGEHCSTDCYERTAEEVVGKDSMVREPEPEYMPMQFITPKKFWDGVD